MSTGMPLTILTSPDRSDAADAARFRWLLANGEDAIAAVAYRSRAACEFGDAVPAIDAAMNDGPLLRLSFEMSDDGLISSA